MEESNLFRSKILELNSKRKYAFFTRLAIVGIILLIVVLYFLLPFSRVENVSLTGNYYFSTSEILSIMELKSNTYVINIDKNVVKENLESHALFNKVDINITPISLKINVEEKALIFKNEDSYYFNDFSVLDKEVEENLLYKEKLDIEKNKIPTLLNQINKEENACLNLINKITLGLCSYENLKLDYIKYEKLNNVDYDVFICFKILDQYLINRHFDKNKDAYFIFKLNASNVNYFINNVKNGLRFFSSTLSKFYNELIKGYVSNNNINEAKLINEENYAYCLFKLNFDAKKQNLEIITSKEGVNNG